MYWDCPVGHCRVAGIDPITIAIVVRQLQQVRRIASQTRIRLPTPSLIEGPIKVGNGSYRGLIQLFHRVIANIFQ